MTLESRRRKIGYWLYRRRGLGLIPLLGIGLLVNVKYLPPQSSNFMMMAGAIGILFGSLLRIVCSTFMTHREAHDPFQVKHLITDGPFALTRNPLYLAEGAIALGIAMMSRMPWFVFVTLLSGLAVMALVIEWEEETLSLRFGRLYDQYCRAVPRWFSWSRLFHPDSYMNTKGRVKLLTAIRAESGTLLIGLLAILAFIAKADIEIFLMSHLFP